MWEYQVWLTHLFLRNTNIAHFMNTRWAWPMAETVHFLGLSLLIGTIGVFDLRLMGMAKSIPIRALHRLVPWGVAGYCINIMTGFLFLSTTPDQYIFNSAFHFKLLFMTVAGINVLLFYTTMFRKVRMLGPGEQAPMAARIIGGVSMFCWVGVLTCGRLLTFFRPPFHVN